jgi:hypothetical protein
MAASKPAIFQCFLFAYITIVSGSLPGCKSRTKSQVKNNLAADKKEFGVMHKIHEDTLRICILKIDRNSTGNTASSSQNKILPRAKIEPSTKPQSQSEKTISYPKFQESTISDKKTMLQSAFRLWTSPISKFAAKSVIRNIEFFDETNGCSLGQDANKNLADLSVVIDNAVGVNNSLYNVSFGALAWVHPHMPGQIWMFLGIESSFEVILHETGHTFGLGDAYEEAGKPNDRPASIMEKLNKSWNGELYPVDELAIKFSYCKIYREQNAEICSQLKSKDIGGQYMEINPDGTNRFQFKQLGILLEEYSTCSALSDFEVNSETNTVLFCSKIDEKIHLRVVKVLDQAPKEIKDRVEAGDC